MKLFKILGLGILVNIPLVLNAQDDVDVFLEAGVEDAKILTQAYIEPLINGFGYGINNGWYNTAKPHKSFGFDLTVTAHLVYAPNSSQFSTFRNSDYQKIRLANGEDNAQMPTAFGPNEEGPELEILDENGQPTGTTFNTPEGLGIKEELGVNAIPVPMAQLGIGIVKNTDIKLRFVPEIDFGDGQVSLWGVGIMHDIKQWIPGIKALPFDLSVLGGYTKLTTTSDLDEANSNGSSSNQEAEFTASGLTFQAIISKKISVLTVYGALGYNSVKSGIKVKGEYEVEGRTLENPIDMTLSDGSMRATAGFRLKLAILTLHADYTLNKYPILTAGVGFSVW